MKKYLLSTILLLLVKISTIAQVSLQPNIPPVGMLQKSQLWNVLVINSSNTALDCKLQLLLRDRNTGQEVLTATTGFFNIGAGAKQLNINLLNPIQYNYLVNGIDSRLQGLLPAGNYLACYSLSSGTGKTQLAEECVQFDVEPLSPPMLIFPTDSSKLDNQPSQFSWTPPTPVGMFNGLRYEVIITPVNEGQKAEEAIQENLPFYSSENTISNMLNYSTATTAFEKDKWYAWQVIAKNDQNYAGKSQTWVFKIKGPSIETMILEQSPYIKMKKQNPEKGIAPNGILKLSYLNEPSDSMALVNIISVKNGNKIIGHFSVQLQPGENLLQFDLKKKLDLKEGEVYEAWITNTRMEKWGLQFEIHDYSDPKKSNN